MGEQGTPFRDASPIEAHLMFPPPSRTRGWSKYSRNLLATRWLDRDGLMFVRLSHPSSRFGVRGSVLQGLTDTGWKSIQGYNHMQIYECVYLDVGG